MVVRPAFYTIVTGWSMDKPVERIRVLGTSPETDEAGIRHVMGQYGEILKNPEGIHFQETSWVYKWYLDSENDIKSRNIPTTFPDHKR